MTSLLRTLPLERPRARVSFRAKGAHALHCFAEICCQLAAEPPAPVRWRLTTTWKCWMTGWTTEVPRNHGSPRHQLQQGCHQVWNLLLRHPAGAGFDLRSYLWNPHAWKHLPHAGLALDARARPPDKIAKAGSAWLVRAATSTTATRRADG